MRKVFLDTHYLIAFTSPPDQWHEAAKEASLRLGDRVQTVTTTDVLTEYLNGASRQGDYLREKAVNTVSALMNDPQTTIVPPSLALFLRGLGFYQSRSDKSYSMVDCISMVVMQDEGVTDILSNDHHFAQEGFTCLIQRA